MRRLLIAAAALVLGAGPALAGPVTLRAEPTDDDGRITLGELFDGAGAAAGVLVGTRAGPSAVLDAAQVQLIARRHGLLWTNPDGLRRIVVRAGAGPAAAPAARGAATVEVLTYARSLTVGETVRPEDVVWTPVQAHLAPADAPADAEAVIGLAARRALRAGAPVRPTDLSAPRVIARQELIEVVYVSGGVSLSLQARALEDAVAGQAFRAQNIQSGRTIEVVAAGPGLAVAGPEARALRAQSFAALR